MSKTIARWGIAAVVLLSSVASVQADPLTCQREIVRAGAKFVRTKMKLEQRCHDHIVSGARVDPCPSPIGDVRVAKARARLWDAVERACGGPDTQCGTGDDESLAAIGWDIGSCVNLPNSGCGNTITDCDGVSACLTCLGDVAVDWAIDLYYDALTVPASHPLVQRCQQAIGKKSAELFKGRAKALEKCEDNVLKGVTAGPCPDLNAAHRIARLESNLSKALCKACGGLNHQCDDPEHVTLSAIGFADNCPDIAIPGGGSCARAIETVADAVECATCVTTFASACVGSATVPWAGLPGECTGQSTPAVCGNLLIETGEVCEFPAIGCGLLELCAGDCTECTPLP